MKRCLLIAFGAVFVLLAAGFALAEEGLTDKEILVGAHHDLSGPLAGWSVPWIKGIEMKFKEVNEAGGVHGRKLRYICEDNKYDPKTAVMVTMKLINRDKVFCFLSNAGSPTALATKNLISDRKIPQLFPVTCAEKFFKPHDRYSFLGNTPYYDQGRGIVNWFHKEKNIKRFAVIYQDDEMGLSQLEGVKDQVAQYPDSKLVASASFKRGATDFSSQIAKLKMENPEILIVSAVIREPVGIMKELKRIGWNIALCGFASSQSPLIPALAEKSGISADGFYVASMLPNVYEDSPIPFVREWFKKYKTMYGNEPDNAAAYGYFFAELFVTALEKAGPNLTREKLVDSLEKNFKNYKIRFGIPPLTFTSSDHKGVAGCVIQQIQKGHYRTVSSDFVDWTKP